MSTLISVANLLDECDTVGKIYVAVKGGIDTAIVLAQGLASSEQTSIFAADVSQFLEWIGATQGMYGGNTAYSGNGTGSSFSSLAGFGGGSSFGGGSGMLSRFAMAPAILYNKLECIRKEIAKYGSQVSATIVDLGSFAAFYNDATAYSCLYSPSLSSAFYYAYGGSQQLPAGSVFAPEGIALATATITGAGTVSVVDIPLPQINGYAAPAPVTDSAGYPLYPGYQPSAQGFAPVKNLEALVTTTVNGTCEVSVVCAKAGGGTDTWTGSLSAAVAGAVVPLSPGIGGSRAVASPAGGAVTVAGTATAGGFTVQTGAPERVYL